MAKPYSESLTRYHLPEFKPQWGALKRGIEKECLRVTPSGHIATSDHPSVLGSALANPYITTDFSEALLEFITPVYDNIDECLGMLENIHRFTLQNLENDEMMWVSSMPCPLAAESDIRLAEYGSSNIGRLKYLYRQGLSNRYGRLMQVIAGIHYNFSMPESFWPPYQKICGDQGSLQEFRSSKYLHLIRNFHRYSWLLIYLFGASPAACKCFVQGRKHNLQPLDDYSLYLPHATCLRMGNLGYKSDAQKSLFVCYNDMGSYADCLATAMRTPYPAYEKIGLKKDGEYLQINANLLQLENEFYSTIRPKRVIKKGQRPLHALTSEGIEYVEVRLLDLNPYLPLGIDAEQINFLDTFLLHCLLSESPTCHKQEFFEVSSNIALVVEQGRDPALQLNLEGKPKGMREWANELCADLAHSAALLDEIKGSNKHQASLDVQTAKVNNPALTPSGKILAEMQANKLSFFNFSMQQSRTNKAYLQNNGLDAKAAAHMRTTAAQSIIEQREIEEADELSFDDFLAQWNTN